MVEGSRESVPDSRTVVEISGDLVADLKRGGAMGNGRRERLQHCCIYNLNK